MSRATTMSKTARFGAWEVTPLGTCRICGMYDPVDLNSWGGGLAHDTCVEWLGDPYQAPLPCYPHTYGSWGPFPGGERPRRRRHCDRCGGYQTEYIGARREWQPIVGGHASGNTTIHDLPPLPEWLTRRPN